MPLPLLDSLLAMQETTTTTVVERIAGDPLPTWAYFAVIAAVLAFILIGGTIVNRRTRHQR